jgi:hypothetical protein
VNERSGSIAVSTFSPVRCESASRLARASFAWRSSEVKIAERYWRDQPPLEVSAPSQKISRSFS